VDTRGDEKIFGAKMRKDQGGNEMKCKYS
jgi:hypothetical protein